MRTLTIAGFLVLLSGMLVVGLVARTRPQVVAPFDVMVQRVLGPRPARVALVLFWWWLAWHFLVDRSVEPPIH